MRLYGRQCATKGLVFGTGTRIENENTMKLFRSENGLLYYFIRFVIIAFTAVLPKKVCADSCDDIAKLNAPWGCNQLVEAPLRYDSQNDTKIKIEYDVLPKFSSIEDRSDLNLDTNLGSEFVVILPGGPLNTRLSQNHRFIKELRRRFHVILIEYRGVGGSYLDDHLTRNSAIMNTQNLVHDLEVVRKTILGDRRWVVFGHSFGVFVALSYASLFQNQISHLIIANGFHDYKIFGSQMSDYFRGFSKQIREKIAKNFPTKSAELIRLYEDLESKAVQHLLFVTYEDKFLSVNRTHFIDPRDLGFHFLRLLDSGMNLDDTLWILRNWNSNNPAIRPWIKRNFGGIANPSNVNETFNCKEVLPQLNSIKTFDTKILEDINALFILEGRCKNTIGPDQKSIIDLSKIQVPTLIIGAEDDSIVPINFQKETAQGISHAKLISLHRGGHFPFFNDPIGLQEIFKFVGENH